jgi:hypothetical protein
VIIGRNANEEGPMVEPRVYAWLVADRLAVAERPGGGGRSHRITRRTAELEWWSVHGVTSIVSGMRTRHGLLEAALAGFRVCWHPLTEPDPSAREVPALADRALAEMDRGDGAVLVHVDRPGEWLAGVDAALRLALGLARTRGDALAQAAGDGLPVGEVSRSLIAATTRRAPAGVA